MDDVTTVSNIIYLSTIERRGLLSSTPVSWKSALWERGSIESAMLRVPIVILVFVFLWGINLFIFEKLRLQYHSAIAIKSAPLGFVFLVATTLTIIYALTMTVLSNLGGYSVEIGISTFYCVLLLFALMPQIPGQETKASFFRLLKSVFSPGASVAFAEVLLADALTSLSKVLKDLGVTMVSVYAVLTNTPLLDLHNPSMILVAVFASIPFAIRIRQCLIQYECASDNHAAQLPIVLNIIKYATSFPPIWLAAAASLGYFHPKLPAATAILASINSVYSYAWDIVMDWGIVSLSSKANSGWWRKRQFFPTPVYLLAMVVNLVLRFSWAANRVPFFAAMHPAQLVLCIEVAEVFRRFVWIFLRVEWEIIVQAERAASIRDEDSEKLLLPKPVRQGSSNTLMSIAP